MKREAIRAEIESALKRLGFAAGQYKWSGCTLDIVIAGTFRTIRIPAGVSRRALTWEMARVTGWVEALTGDYTAINPELRAVVKPRRQTRRLAAAPVELHA